MVATYYIDGLKKIVKKRMVKYKSYMLNKNNSPTGNSGSTSLPSIGDSFMYIESSSKKPRSGKVCLYL